MELYIFDKYLNRLGIIDKYESLLWTRKTSEVGMFELHCKFENDNLELLKKDNIIFKSNDLEEGVYIENIYIEEDDKGLESIKVIGQFISGYIGKRIIWNTENIKDTVENAMLRLVDNNCINTIESRKIPSLGLNDAKGYIEKINYQVSYKNLEEEIVKISKEKDINFRVITDLKNKIHKFDTYKGIDRTVNQNINSFCIFSKEFENICKQSYSNETDNIKNVALVAGEGEGSSRVFTTIGDKIGIERHELFVDADDIRSTKEDNTVITKEEYIKLIEQRGLEKLAGYKEVINFEGGINVTGSNLIYRKDFDLGDYVTLINKKWNVILNVKVVEVEEIYEKDGFKVNVIFGDKVPTLIDKVERRL